MQSFGWTAKSITESGSDYSILLERPDNIPHKAELDALELKMETADKLALESYEKAARAELKLTYPKAIIFAAIGLIIPTGFVENPAGIWVLKIILMGIGLGIFIARKTLVKKHEQDGSDFIDLMFEYADQARELLEKK